MGFADPLALAFTLLFGVLVLYYLWERWRRREIVPSMLLWEAVRDDVLRPRHFRPDWLFVLQALALACLIGGLARPYLRENKPTPVGTRHIFVFDTSASMQTREARGTRLEQARAQALQRLDRLAPGEEVMLITAGATPEIAVGYTRDRERVTRALERIRAVDSGGDLSLSLAFALNALQRSDMPALVETFTDIPRNQLPPAVRDQVAVFQVGESDDNLGIESLQVFQGRFQDFHNASVQVQVRNYARREGHGLLTVQLEDQVVRRTGFSLAGRETQAFRIDEFPAPGRVLAHLEVDDALAVDNTAYGWIRPLRPLRIAVVSQPSPFVDDLQGLAAATSGLQITTGVSSESVRPQDFDLVIFNGVAPSAVPPVNALLIYPPADNSLFPAVGAADNVEVIDWNSRHPALQGLHPLAALPLQRARILNPPEWTQVLLWSRTSEREFPLALAGEHDGHRVACLTFDLAAERLLSSDNVNFLLFFLNLVDWLTPNASDAAVVRTGDAYLTADHDKQPLRVRDPRGTLSELAPGQGGLTPYFVGEYEISNGTRRRLFANFFDPVESDIGRASPESTVFPAALPAAVTAAPVLPPDFGHWLYALGACLLLLEWVVSRRLEG
ncbi:MAG TPA: BatA and WFA domain-containing protein [Candidatus Acidoferrales bacterium]|nr:BatA and WFA domain-containing protein [Candidatus Acidoferrales bacterium]